MRIRFSLFIFAIVGALSGIASAATIGFDTLDARFHGTPGETRPLGTAVVSVGYWQDVTGPRQAMMVSVTSGVASYTLLNIPTFNGIKPVGNSNARGISADGTIVVAAGYTGIGDRPVRVSYNAPNVGQVISAGLGLGNSYVASGITGNGTIFGSQFSVIISGSNSYTALNTGSLLDGEVLDGRTVGGQDRLVGVGTDGLNNFLAAWSGLNLTATRSCGTGLCAPGRLDFNNNPVTSVTFNGQLGYWNYMNDSLTLPNFSFGAGAIDRGLWVDSVATRLFYTQNNLLGVYDSRTNTGLLWNPYCIANSDFCAAVATAAKDLGKGNSNGVNWFNTVDGTSYLTRNNAGSSTVPEPRTYLLFGTGLFLMGLVNQIRNHKRV